MILKYVYLLPFNGSVEKEWGLNLLYEIMIIFASWKMNISKQ